MEPSERARRSTEDWFIRRGVPHFIADYDARTDIFTRAWWVLGLVFLLEMVAPVNEDFPWYLNLAVVAAGLGVLVAVLALLNRRRGRPWHHRPDTIGVAELAVFVLVPPLLPLVFGFNEDDAAVTVVLNVVLLGLIYLVTSYGLVPMTRWAIGQLSAQMRNVLNLMFRSMPLLLIFTMFMFVNAEMWKIATDIPGDFYAAAISLLVIVGSLFLFLRLPRELETVAHFDSWQEVAGLVSSAPVAGLDLGGLEDPPQARPLGWRARVNLLLVLFISQATQILFVTVAIATFYFLFGVLTISEGTISLWTGSQEPGVVTEVTIFENRVVVTGALLRAAGFIASIAGLQFTVSALTDQTYREEFAEEHIAAVRENLAVREVYLALVELAEGETGERGPLLTA